MCGDKEIEVLLLMDNKKRTIGLKRDGLLQMSRGKYFMFIDDDDDLVSVDEIYQATFQDVDVITFKQMCRGLDAKKTPFVVTFGIGNDNEPGNGPEYGVYVDCKRPPYHVCAWNQKFKVQRYADMAYGEDWDWVQRCIPDAKTEVFIDKILHRYDFDLSVSEAPGPVQPYNMASRPTNAPLRFLRRR